MTLAELQARREALLALPAGVESVTFNNRTTQLSSQEDRDAALASIDRQIAALQGQVGATFHVGVTSKGYD